MAQSKAAETVYTRRISLTFPKPYKPYPCLTAPYLRHSEAVLKEFDRVGILQKKCDVTDVVLSICAVLFCNNPFHMFNL